MLEQLKQSVYEANMQLFRSGLSIETWGNVSGRDQETGLFVIKPSGVPYTSLTPDDMVVMDLSGRKIEGSYQPSTDTPTHIELYKNYPFIHGIVHTHSTEAVAWAQAGYDIPVYGTTHADNFLTQIPCTRDLTADEIDEDYESNTGKVIVETFKEKNINPEYTPAVLCKNHGPFIWGKDPINAVHHAIILENIARIAKDTYLLNPSVEQVSKELIEKHFYRKHGKSAYYGQQI